MYKLLIVDDEPDVVNGLCAYFEDFDELELDIYTAYSGYEALDILNDTRIDIILSDILMPGMTGLELLEKVRANWPHCCVIFLTGHDEFSYVYTAIRYEYVYYLLKTEGFHAIGKTLVKAAAQIENHLKMSELLKKSEEYMETALPFMQKDYLANLLNGDEDNAADRSRQFKELKIPLDWNRPVLLLLGRMTGLDGNLSSYERSRLIFAVQAVAEEYFPKGIHAFFLPIDRYLLLWIIQPGEEEEKSGELWQHIKNQTKSSAEVIQNICLDQLNLSISFILDCDKAAWEEVSQRYSSLKTLIHYHLGPESELLLMTRSPEMGLPQQDFIYGYRKLKSLETYLESLQRDEFLNTLLEIYENLKKTDNLSRNALLEVYYTVALTILGYINRYGLTEKISYHTGLDKLIRIEEHASWQDAMEYLIGLVNMIFDFREQDSRKYSVSSIDAIILYINEHLNEDLSLAKMADRFHFNSSYLSRLFKRETGINFQTYINEARLEKAKQLLKNTDMKIYEIANAIGCETPSYFTQFFKRNANISPMKYREIHLMRKSVKKTKQQ